MSEPLYVVSATLNGLPYTQQLVSAIAQVNAAVVGLRMVIVDQGSTDGTLDWLSALRATSPDGREVPLVPSAIAVIANRRNTGAAGAWNTGIRFALDNGAKAILVCGNDTCPFPGTVERLWQDVQSGIPFVTGQAVPYATPPEPVPALETDASTPLLAAPDFSFYMVTAECIGALGKWDASVEIDRQFRARQSNEPSPPAFMSPWEWGLFDSRYAPAYFEDNDYHTRLHHAGIAAVCDPMAKFRHETSLTIRLNPDVAQQNQTQFNVNAQLYKAKWGGLPHEVGSLGARPLNVTDEQWVRMSGGRPVLTVDRAVLAEQAQATYQRYGVAA